MEIIVGIFVSLISLAILAATIIFAGIFVVIALIIGVPIVAYLVWKAKKSGKFQPRDHDIKKNDGKTIDGEFDRVE